MDTKTRVSSKSVVAVVGLVIILGTSFVVSTILSTSSAGRFYGSGSIVTGYCVYNPRSTNSTFAGGDMDQDACKKKVQADKITPDWAAFCPGVSGSSTTKGGDGECNCATPNTNISIEGQIKSRIDGRDGLINSFNDESMTDADKKDKVYLGYGVALKCACGVDVTATLSDSDLEKDDLGNPILNPDGEKLYRWAGFTGVAELVHLYGKLMSKLSVYNPSTHECESKIPAGCKISSSYRSGDGTSEHAYGKALDFNCGEKWSTEPTSNCSTTTQKLLEALQSANPGFDIIRECNRAERVCNTNLDPPPDVQVIHLDLGNSNKRPHPSDQLCTYMNCNYTNCN